MGEGPPLGRRSHHSGAAIIIVGGIIVVGSGAVAGGVIIAGSQAGATTIGGATLIGGILLTGLIVTTVLIDGVAHEVYSGNTGVVPGLVDLSGLVPDFTIPRLIGDFVLASATGATVSAADVLYENDSVKYETQLPNNAQQAPKVREAIKTTLVACAANLTVDVAIAQFGYVFTQLGLQMPQVDEDLQDINGRHICNFVPTIMYGNRSVTGLASGSDDGDAPHQRGREPARPRKLYV